MTLLIKQLMLSGLIVCLFSCKDTKPQKNKNYISNKVSATSQTLHNNISEYKLITNLDHHQMAKEAGVYTPPSIATIFSSSEINTALIKENQLVALDLPFKILCYAEKDTTGVNIAYTSGDFISKRHEIPLNHLKGYNQAMNQTLAQLPTNLISNTNTKDISKNFGIVTLKSDFNFETTVTNLKNIVMSQNDTQWFADIDFQKEAKDLNIDIRPTKLLLFGGPAPGGKAMVTTPKIGLDAFCQKLLVYEGSDKHIFICYNDIVAFSELYYNTSTKPQHFINKRLKATFSKAIHKE